jgi:hypothetical protein
MLKVNNAKQLINIGKHAKNSKVSNKVIVSHV